jgi:hypothetical protein
MGVLWEGVSGSTFRPFFDKNGGSLAYLTLPTAQWIMLTYTYNGVGVSSYAYTTSNTYTDYTATSAFSIPASGWYLGKFETSGYGTLNGSLSNVQIYNISLSASQVQALYQEGIGGAPINPMYLVGWWPLNGNANDYSGNNNNGQAANVIYTSSWTSGYSVP